MNPAFTRGHVNQLARFGPARSHRDWEGACRQEAARPCPCSSLWAVLVGPEAKTAGANLVPAAWVDRAALRLSGGACLAGARTAGVAGDAAGLVTLTALISKWELAGTPGAIDRAAAAHARGASRARLRLGVGGGGDRITRASRTVVAAAAVDRHRAGLGACLITGITEATARTPRAVAGARSRAGRRTGGHPRTPPRLRAGASIA
jgi:hypothetical protein